MKPWITRLSILATIFAFGVIILGAYTRLNDAGLGCPDWPGCYGQWVAPQTKEAISSANENYPAMQVDVKKAQTEMTHRYFAETLGSLIVLLAALCIWKRREIKIPPWLPPTLVVLVVIQGLLGMWTVTLRLWPVVVMAHLLGGFSTLGLLWLSFLYARSKPIAHKIIPKGLPALALFTLIVLILQIALGGWTSANYAALICPDFPTCQGQWWPQGLNFRQAFDLTGGLGTQNPLAFMETGGKTAIHLSHRIGAAFTFLIGMLLAVRMLRWNKHLSFVLIFLLLLQVVLGISNVIMHLNLHVALTHHAVAALMFITLISINFRLWSKNNG